MKKLLLVCSLLLSSLCVAQNASTIQYIAAAGSGPVTNSGINQQTLGKVHQLTWSVTGTVSTCTVAIDTSADGVTWNAGALIANQTCTSSGQSGAIIGVANFVRVNVTVLSGTGSVTFTYSYWTGANDPCIANWIPKTTVFTGTISTATTTGLASAVAGSTIFLCSYSVLGIATTTPDTVTLEFGTTNGTCSTPTVVTAAWQFQSTAANGGIFMFNQGGGAIAKSAAGQSLCIVSTVGTSPTIIVSALIVQMP